MKNRSCNWQIVYSTQEKTSVSRIRLTKCYTCTKLNYIGDCIVNSIANNVMIIRYK